MEECNEAQLTDENGVRCLNNKRMLHTHVPTYMQERSCAHTHKMLPIWKQNRQSFDGGTQRSATHWREWREMPKQQKNTTHACTHVQAGTDLCTHTKFHPSENKIVQNFDGERQWSATHWREWCEMHEQQKNATHPCTHVHAGMELCPHKISPISKQNRQSFERETQQQSATHWREWCVACIAPRWLPVPASPWWRAFRTWSAAGCCCAQSPSHAPGAPSPQSMASQSSPGCSRTWGQGQQGSPVASREGEKMQQRRVCFCYLMFTAVLGDKVSRVHLSHAEKNKINVTKVCVRMLSYVGSHIWGQGQQSSPVASREKQKSKYDNSVNKLIHRFDKLVGAHLTVYYHLDQPKPPTNQSTKHMHSLLVWERIQNQTNPPQKSDTRMTASVLKTRSKHAKGSKERCL